MTLDPRARLALLGAALVGILAGGATAVAGGLAIATAWAARGGPWSAYARPLVALAPLALALVALDAIAGRAAEGALVAARLGAVTFLALAFARRADAREMTDALRALRIPYPLVFVLVAGARFVPVTASDLGELRSAAVLRGVYRSGSAWARLDAFRVLLVPLLVVSIRRGLQLGEAMEARGFGSGTRRTSRRRLRWSPRDTLALLIAATYLVAVLAAP